MTDRIVTEDARHEQLLAESVPSPISPPLATVEPEQRDDRGVQATGAGGAPLAVLRYRPGVIGETSRIVQVVPLPLGGEAGTAGVALYGALLCPDEVETVTPGHGVPCSRCVISHISADPAPTPVDIPATARPTEVISSETRPLPAGVGHRVWGWPVELLGDHMWLYPTSWL
jgi:hypothetical protein